MCYIAPCFAIFQFVFNEHSMYIQCTFTIHSMYIQCLAIYPLFGLMVHSHRQTDRLSYPNSRDAIASKNYRTLLQESCIMSSYFELTISDCSGTSILLLYGFNAINTNHNLQALLSSWLGTPQLIKSVRFGFLMK